VLGQQIRRVLLAWNFSHSKVAVTKAILHPQVLHTDVPKFAQALSLHDAECR
jgi:hypothetical protein